LPKINCHAGSAVFFQASSLAQQETPIKPLPKQISQTSPACLLQDLHQLFRFAANANASRLMVWTDLINEMHLPYKYYVISKVRRSEARRNDSFGENLDVLYLNHERHAGSYQARDTCWFHLKKAI